MNKGYKERQSVYSHGQKFDWRGTQKSQSMGEYVDNSHPESPTDDHKWRNENLKDYIDEKVDPLYSIFSQSNEQIQGVLDRLEYQEKVLRDIQESNGRIETGIGQNDKERNGPMKRLREENQELNEMVEEKEKEIEKLKRRIDELEKNDDEISTNLDQEEEVNFEQTVLDAMKQYFVNKLKEESDSAKSSEDEGKGDEDQSEKSYEKLEEIFSSENLQGDDTRPMRDPKSTPQIKKKRKITKRTNNQDRDFKILEE